MKALLKLVLAAFFMVVCLTGCTDPKSVFDQNTEIDNHTWSYLNKIKFAVKIDNAAVPYNLYLNLRVTNDYKYSNMFVLMHIAGPEMKAHLTRNEIKMANADGEWLGKGSGNLYNYQVSFLRNYKFPAKGVYHFEIEQNMRDNPLQAVSDVGLRVEKAN